MNGFEILPSSSGGSDPLKLDLAGGTMTGQLVLQLASATGAVNVSPTWNNGAVSFVGIYGRVTNTASGAASKLIDLGTVAAGSLFSVDATGIMEGFDVRGIYVRGVAFCKGEQIVIGGLNQVYLWHDGNGKLRLQGYGSTDPFYELQLGNPHATTPTAATIKAHNVTTGTGADLILSGGTGSVANGNVIISKLPTSNPGPGILWNSGGTPAIGT